MSTGPGPVVYLGLSHRALISTWFGAAYAGRPFVPLNYRFKPEEIAPLIERIKPALIVADPELLPKVTGVDAGIRSVSSEHHPPLAGSDHVEGPMVPGAAAVYLFTSGTSGEPKAAIITHENLFQYVVDTAEAASSDAHESILISTPPYHIAALANVLTNVFRCRRLVLLPRFQAREWLNVARSESVTHAMVVPTMLARILDEVEEDPATWPPSIVSLSYGGSKSPPGLVERAMRLLPAHVGLVNAFGLTETSSTVAMLTPEDHRLALEDDKFKERLQSVGRPVPGVDVRVVRADGVTAETDVTGEVWVRGEHVSPGYLTGASRVDREGWLHTGDAGWLDADGYLFISGRQDDLIIRGGEKIDPAEVEDVLARHPGVSEAAVVGVPDPEWGEVIAAVVVGNGSASEDDLKVWVRSRLAGYKVPVRIRWADALPRNDMGKVMRRQAAKMFEEVQ